MKQRLIVFAKAPRLGSVKTRLAQDIGRMAALAFYKASLERTVRLANTLPGVETLVCTAPDSAVRGRYFPAALAIHPQGVGDLGQRMARVMDSDTGANRVLIGGDIPGIAPGDLKTAFQALGSHDAVFGPAEDGGFWLVGLRAGFRPRDLFRNVTWSAPSTMQEALATLPAHSRVAFTSTLNDIDNLEDYWRLRSP